ncbi:MAG: cell filamentation protein Fic, partial [Mollicutes bacterium]|nr:cell filamentation protein Fic [Mollicutes bacterium]
MENKGEVIIYETEDGLTKIDIKLEDENIWLNQEQLVLLFQSSKSNVSEHIKNIFNEGELIESS